MTPTEILTEINKLPMSERQIVIDSLNNTETEEESIDLRLQKMLYEDGLLREIKPRRQRRIGDFPAIKIEGEPVSEMIIRERR